MGKLLTYLIVVPQIIVLAQNLYKTASQVDDDPGVKAAFERFKDDPVIAGWHLTLRTQIEVILGLVQQLKDA